MPLRIIFPQGNPIRISSEMARYTTTTTTTITDRKRIEQTNLKQGDEEEEAIGVASKLFEEEARQEGEQVVLGGGDAVAAEALAGRQQADGAALDHRRPRFGRSAGVGPARRSVFVFFYAPVTKQQQQQQQSTSIRAAVTTLLRSLSTWGRLVVGHRPQRPPFDYPQVGGNGKEMIKATGPSWARGNPNDPRGGHDPPDGSLCLKRCWRPFVVSIATQ